MSPKNMKALKLFKNDLRKMSKKILRQKIKNLAIQKGGFLQLLLTPALRLMDLLVNERLS